MTHALARCSSLLTVLALVAVLAIGAEVRAQDGPPALPAGLDGQADDDAPPALPSGMDDDAAPALPSGLDDDDAGPALPSGLDDGDTRPAAAPAEVDQRPEWFSITGFWEVRGGVRTQHDPYERCASIGESRLHLQWEHTFEPGYTVNVTGDLLYDAVLDRHAVDLGRGEGFFDLRQANVMFTPVDWMDIKIGRQILTWGTGDLVFLNDLFPKDWQSFFIGRDIEYLKAPSDAMKFSIFTDAANMDIVFTPKFDSDRYITGRRLSYYNATLGRRAGRDAIVDEQTRNDWFGDFELAGRLYRNVEGYELAAYGYHGFFKSPGGMDPFTGEATFPRLNVYGASVRGPIWRGIGNVEVAYHDSIQDRDGSNPFINNSQFRLLVGYKQDLPDLAEDLTVGFQYYLELMTHYERYRASLPPGAPSANEGRHVLTMRITKLAMSQNLTLSLFAFYSPNDRDAYLRPSVSYKIDDHWTVEAGGNVFFGDDRYSFFNQFANNTNVYAALRYGF